jgi:hypothetical protein
MSLRIFITSETVTAMWVCFLLANSIRPLNLFSKHVPGGACALLGLASSCTDFFLARVKEPYGTVGLSENWGLFIATAFGVGFALAAARAGLVAVRVAGSCGIVSNGIILATAMAYLIIVLR